MRILITGSLGVLGSKLFALLEAAGNDVFGVDLYHTDQLYYRLHGPEMQETQYMRADISEFRQIEKAIKTFKPDLVYNTAAEFGRWNGEQYYEQLWKSNAVGLKHLLVLQREHGFNLVHFSSSEVYGDFKLTMVEDSLDKHVIDQMNDYALTKKINEVQIKNEGLTYGTADKTAIIRLFNTYGPGETYHPFRSVNCLFCYNLLHGRPITVYKGHSRTSTYIDDAVTALSNFAISSFKEELGNKIFNIASSKLHDIETLAQYVCEAADADPLLIEYAESEKMTTHTKVVNNQRSVDLLDFKETVDLKQGVINTVKWMKDYYRL